jgi:hypothetical protein
MTRLRWHCVIMLHLIADSDLDSCFKWMLSVQEVRTAQCSLQFKTTIFLLSSAHTRFMRHAPIERAGLRELCHPTTYTAKPYPEFAAPARGFQPCACAVASPLPLSLGSAGGPQHRAEKKPVKWLFLTCVKLVQAVSTLPHNVHPFACCVKTFLCCNGL